MKIEIEIGTEEQKNLVLQEMLIIKNIVQELNKGDVKKPIKIVGIWVPEDFNKRVNEIQGTFDYESNRGHVAIGKNITTDEGTHLVFSKLLFTEFEDTQTRMQTYLHELWHVFTKNIIPDIPQDSILDQEYFPNLYILFDEYMVNRLSYKILDDLFLEKSKLFKDRVEGQIKGFQRDLTDDKYYNGIREEIRKFRIHGEIETYLKNTHECFDEVSKALVYFYSLKDHYKEYAPFEQLLNRSSFVNESSKALINYFRDKFDDGEFDLSDGLDKIRNYMMNFGIEFCERDNGLYCYIRDIK